MKYLIPNDVYNVLKWVGLVVCPALATFYGAVAPAWGWYNPENIVLLLNSLGLLIGALIGVSHITATEYERDDEDER